MTPQALETRQTNAAGKREDLCTVRFNNKSLPNSWCNITQGFCLAASSGLSVAFVDELVPPWHAHDTLRIATILPTRRERHWGFSQPRDRTASKNQGSRMLPAPNRGVSGKIQPSPPVSRPSSSSHAALLTLGSCPPASGNKKQKKKRQKTNRVSPFQGQSQEYCLPV